MLASHLAEYELDQDSKTVNVICFVALEFLALPIKIRIENFLSLCIFFTGEIVWDHISVEKTKQ